MLDLQQCITMACLLDVTTPKPGNVHRGADFPDMTFRDFAASAVAIGPCMANAATQPLGKTVLQSIVATRNVTQTNTNLGIVMLLAPLAKVAAADNRPYAIGETLGSLTPADAADFYSAIRLASAGGLGSVGKHDVNEATPPENLMDAMQLAKDRDRIAWLYVTHFDLILQKLAPQLAQSCLQHGLENGLISTYIDVMVEFPDSLIARKCGASMAMESADRAAKVRETKAEIGSEAWWNSLAELDFWLRADGNRRNPGTSADLLTAAMFIALYDQSVNLCHITPNR